MKGKIIMPVFNTAEEHKQYLLFSYGQEKLNRALKELEESYGAHSIDAYEDHNFDLLEDIIATY